jgi:predicted PurR-regulated permease PerM
MKATILSTSEFVRRLLIIVAFGAILALLYQVIGLLLILFGAVLLAVVLSSASNALCGVTKVSRGWALSVVVITLLVVVGAVVWQFGSRISVEVAQLYAAIPASLTQLRATVASFSWGQRLIDEASSVNLTAEGGTVLSHVMGAVNSLLGIVTDAVLIFSGGLYLAAQPALYRSGLLSLVPRAYRPRGAEVLDGLYDALRHWLAGQLVSMVVVGVLFAAALTMIGVPSALVLGLIAALAEFIPLVGPVIATIPAVLDSLTLGISTVAWVVLAFVVIQQIESNLLVPFVQRRTVHLAPVVALFSTVIFGVLFGVLGLALAVPLVVATMVLIRMIYVDDILGGPMPEEG